VIAIISDIHSNQEALLAVLKDIHERSVEDIYCLGDITGYGPNPRECVDLIQQHAGVTIRGNHDDALFNGGASDFNLRAEGALNWARKKLFSNNQLPRDRERRITYLKNLPETHEEGDLMFVHGSPRMPLRDYVFPRDVRLKQKMQEIFSKIKRYCFVGHTHIPGVFTPNGVYRHPDDLVGGIYILDEPKALINVGSVGQPRDSDRRACYCTFDGDSLVFRRISYDARTTMKKMYEIEQLDNTLADRLLAGK